MMVMMMVMMMMVVVMMMMVSIMMQGSKNIDMLILKYQLSGQNDKSFLSKI